MKRNLFTVFMLAVTTFLLAAGFVYEVAAQEAVLPDAEFRTWRDPNTERLYWNKHLPVYLYLSPNPNGADAHLLKSESMPRYATPFYFDTEGRNFMRTRWAVDPDTKKAIVPQKEVLWEVYADGLLKHT